MSEDAEGFVPGTKRPPGRWLLRGFLGDRAQGVLQTDSACSVVIDRGDGPEAWIGEVIDRNCQGAILRLFGSGKLLVVPFVQLLRADTIQGTWAEWSHALACQRKGLAPCRLIDGKPVVPDVRPPPEPEPELPPLPPKPLRPVRLTNKQRMKSMHFGRGPGSKAPPLPPAPRLPDPGPGKMWFSVRNVVRLELFAAANDATPEEALDYLLGWVLDRLAAERINNARRRGKPLPPPKGEGARRSPWRREVVVPPELTQGT